jgi:hypothetical protein
LADLQRLAEGYTAELVKNEEAVYTARITPPLENVRVLPADAEGIPVEVPVHATVLWKVFDADKKTELTEQGFGTFLAPTGTADPQVVFEFLPQGVEKGENTAPSNRTHYIRAQVTFTAGEQTHRFLLPGHGDPTAPLTAQSPALKVFDAETIPIPTVMAFFRHRNFDHSPTNPAAFILVPSDSPISNVEELFDELNELQDRVKTLVSVAEQFGFLLAGLQRLIRALDRHPRAHILLRPANQGRDSNEFRNFNDVNLYHIPWWKLWRLIFGGYWDVEAEDELSSLIFIGHPPLPEPGLKERAGATAVCFNARYVKTSDHGHFNITLGWGMSAVIETLHTGNPQPLIATEFQASPLLAGLQATITVENKGQTFGDKLSSFGFPEPAIRDVRVPG